MMNDTQTFGSLGPMASPVFQNLILQSEEQAEMLKAYTTGDGIVQPGTTSPSALREQFLSGVLEQVSFEQSDAGLMHDIAKKSVNSTAVEWADMVAYGGAGDDFVGETGSDGNFNVTGSDDSFLRQMQNVKYMATYRQVGTVAQKVNSVADPMVVAQKAATLELISKINLALYYGDSGKNALQFNGIEQQIRAWADLYPTESQILYDAAGGPIDKDMMLDIAFVCANLYGDPSEFRCSANTFTDTQKTLFPEARYTEGQQGGGFGGNRDTAITPFGNIKLKYDKMLRKNRPLVANGTGVDGKPRVSTTVDAGSLTWATTPFAACAAQAAGLGNFWQNVNLNTDQSILGTAPATPSGAGNNGNRLAAGSYIYGLAPVYGGREGVMWVFGASAANTLAGATAVVPTSGQVVKVDVDAAAITGLGTTYPRSQVSFRLYRAPSTATKFGDFDLLDTIGMPKTGNARGFDNGFRIPGTDTGFLMTRSKGGADAYYLGQLLPLYKRVLPISALADQFALIFFGTPIVRVGRHHVVVRNIGPYTG